MIQRYRTFALLAACLGPLRGHWAAIALIWAMLRAHWVAFALPVLATLVAGGGIGFVLYERQVDKYEIEHEKYLIQAEVSTDLARKLEAAESQRKLAKAAANDLFGEPGWYIVEVRPYATEGLFRVEKHEMETCQSYFERGDELWSSSEAVCNEASFAGCRGCRP